MSVTGETENPHIQRRRLHILFACIYRNTLQEKESKVRRAAAWQASMIEGTDRKGRSALGPF